MRAEVEVARLWDELVACRGDVTRVVDLIVRYAAELFGDTCVLALLSEDGRLLEPAATHHRLPAVRELMTDVLASTPSRVGAGLAGTAAADRRPLLIPRIDPDEVAKWIDPRYRRFFERYPIRSVLIVPMLAYGELVGTLGVVRSESIEPYGNEDLGIMVDLARRAALALVDARREPRQLTTEDYRAMFEHSPDGMLFTVPSGRVLAANPAACEILGRSEKEIVALGRPGLLLGDDPATKAAVAARAASGRMRAELPMRRGDGSVFSADVSSTIFVSSSGEVRACVLFRDISREIAIREELEQRRAETEYLVDHDEVTKLLNRRGFVIAGENALAFALRQGLAAQLVVFEQAARAERDQRMQTADAAARRVAEAIVATVRPVDIVGRTADDQFGVLLIGSTEDDAQHTHRAVLEHLTTSAPGLQVDVGVASRAQRDTTGLIELIEIACEQKDLDTVRARLRRGHPPSDSTPRHADN